jgi:hypothetical protein
MRRGPSRTQGWLRFWDHAEHSHYYHHPSSGQTSWEEPPGATAGHGLDPARDGPAHENGAFPEAPAEEGAPGAGEPGNVTEAPPGSPPGEPGTVPGGCMHWPAQCPPPAVPAPEHGPAVAHTGCAYHDGYDWDAYAREYGCAHVCRVHAAVHCDCVYVRERASVCTTVCVVLARSVRVVLARSVPYSRTLLTYPPHVPSSRTLLTYPTHAPHMPTASPRGTTHTGTTTGARPQVNTRQRTRPLILGVVPTRSPSVRGLNTHTQAASNSEKFSVWLFRIANVLGYWTDL